MGLLASDAVGNLHVTPLAREHLVSGGPFDVSDYVALAANSPAVLEMVERMTTNSPAGKKDDEQGAAFIYRQGQPSAMEKEESARHFTLALAGRAKNVAPYLARQAPLRKTAVLLDVGGGTGIYSIACLQKHPQLRAIIWDRREVLKVASEMAVDYGVADRVELRAGDMFADSVPMADTILLSNILHDWDVPECRQLIGRCSAALPVGGQLLIHDVFLNDSLDGPLAVALYSAALFCVTEGRAYSAAEYRGWLRMCDRRPSIDNVVPCGYGRRCCRGRVGRVRCSRGCGRIGSAGPSVCLTRQGLATMPGGMLGGPAFFKPLPPESRFNGVLPASSVRCSFRAISKPGGGSVW
jgi:predicted O-methyltransferase YrrM